MAVADRWIEADRRDYLPVIEGPVVDDRQGAVELPHVGQARRSAEKDS